MAGSGNPAKMVPRLTPPPVKTPFDVDLYGNGSCVMEVDASGNVVEIVAWARNSLTAQAAFEELCDRNPNKSYQRRQRSWLGAERLVKASTAPAGEGASKQKPSS